MEPIQLDRDENRAPTEAEDRFVWQMLMSLVAVTVVVVALALS